MSVVQTERPLPLHDARAREPHPLRLVPTPSSEPPYDDELPAGLRRHRAAPVPLNPAPLRLVPPLPGQDDEWARPRTPLDALTAAPPFAHAFVQRLLEVLAGVRPLMQLQRDTTPELYQRLERYVAARPRSTGRRPDARDVRSVHVQTRPDGVAEACATVKRQTPSGPRAAAWAFRLEGLDGRWCCTELMGL